MKSRIKIFFIIYILLSILFSSTFTLTCSANNVDSNSLTKQQNDIDLNLYSKSCILIECSTNRVAYEKNADDIMYPASTTKLLTAIIALEKCNLSDTVTITNDMVSKIPTGYTTAYLQVGEILTIEQILNALLIPSANDAGYALAIHISGSIENFSVLMNQKAKEIGCTNSNFVNPSGIHSENHYSTARDLALIGQYSLKYPTITKIGSQTSYSLTSNNGKTRNFETTNTLIKPNENNYYKYATGLKTGYTQPAGSCIVATAKKDDMEFLLVLLGAPIAENNTNYRDLDCQTLFEYGFLNYEEIIKIDKNFLSNFTNFAISGGILNNILKTLLIFTCFYLFYAILTSKKNNEKPKKKKNTNKNTKQLDNINFRCSFW